MYFSYLLVSWDPHIPENCDFFATAPLDNRKPLITVLPLQSKNSNFVSSFTMISLFTILSLPLAQASSYMGLALELGMLHLRFS